MAGNGKGFRDWRVCAARVHVAHLELFAEYAGCGGCEQLRAPHAVCCVKWGGAAAPGLAAAAAAPGSARRRAAAHQAGQAVPLAVDQPVACVRRSDVSGGAGVMCVRGMTRRQGRRRIIRNSPLATRRLAEPARCRCRRGAASASVPRPRGAASRHCPCPPCPRPQLPRTVRVSAVKQPPPQRRRALEPRRHQGVVQAALLHRHRAERDLGACGQSRSVCVWW